MVSVEQAPILKTWEAMEDLYNMGLTKHIGVSNFGVKNLENLLSNAKIKPEMNQIESHPYLQQDDLLAFCKKNEIHITAYCPLGSAGRPERLKSDSDPRLLDDALIGKIAASKNVSAAQVLISWALHRGISVIPKSTNPGRIVQNLASAKVELSDSEMQSISKLNKDFRYISGDTWVKENGPYTIDFIFG